MAGPVISVSTSATGAPGTSRSKERVVVGLMVGLYLVLTAWLSVELNLWRDEMYSLHTSSDSVLGAAHRAIAFELQPPVYFIALASWRKASDAIVFARLLSSLFGASTILVVAALSRRILPRVHPGYPAALFATHPLLIWAGTEIRVYALVFLLSALLTLTFVDAYWLSTLRARSRLAFAAVAVVSLYTQYYLAILLVCFGVALLVRRDRARIVAYAIDAGSALLVCVPLVLAMRADFGSHKSDLGRRVATRGEVVKLVYTRFESYLFSFNEAIDKAWWSFRTIRVVRWLYRALVAGVVGAGLIGLWTRRSKRRDPETQRVMSNARAAGAAIAAYGACMAALFVTVGPLGVGERHTAGLLVPALLALVATPAAAFGRNEVRAFFAFLIVSNVAATVLSQIVPLAKDCDCRHVAETIERREAPREPILVFPAEDALPLSVYYRGQNRLLAVPTPPSYERWDQTAFVIHSANEVAELVESNAPQSRGLWVHTNIYGPTWGPDKLELFLANGYRKAESYSFAQGVVLRHFVRLDVSPSSVASP
jgi:hypothetical protein